MDGAAGVRWLYKIWGGYDGFRPSTISRRLRPGDLLDLGWANYADVADLDDEVWVFFVEGTRFPPSVYVMGRIEEVDPVAKRLVIQVTEWSTKPLVDEATSRLLLDVVRPKGRQVFVLPGEIADTTAGCDAHLGATTCAARNCKSCPLWRNLPNIRPADVTWPQYLSKAAVESFVPGFWVIPQRRSLLARRGLTPRRGVRQTTELFYRFKTGESALAFPLAAGMEAALRARGALHADVIVPVPLSPDKAAAGELHRTLVLAKELSKLIGVPVADALSLNQPISKRVLMNQGYSVTEFKERYTAALDIDTGLLRGAGHVLIVDDVCTRGMTLGAVASAVRKRTGISGVDCTVAGQMVLGHAVQRLSAVVARR
jgi:hypothetical protein